jgi:predicted O-methyltransferase YrrM
MYNEIISLPTPIKLGKWKNTSSLCMYKDGHRTHPISISEEEFHFIRKVIETNNLTRGYEVATAFGISALAAGLGFKNTNGQLLTIDSYIEEQYEWAHGYKDKKEVHHNSLGYQTAKYLHNYFGVGNIIHCNVGWSPDDVSAIIDRSNLNNFDFIFIDGHHTDEGLRNDFSAIWPYVNKQRFICLFHDIARPEDMSEGRTYIEQTTGLSIVALGKQPYLNDTWGIGLLTNILDWSKNL